MRVIFLLGLMVCVAQAENNVLIQLLAKVRIGNCEGDCPCDDSANELSAEQAKLDALETEANNLQDDINEAKTADSSVNGAQDAVNDLKQELNSSSSVPGRYRRGTNTVNFTSCEDSTQSLQGEVGNITSIVLNGILNAVQTVSSSYEVTKLDCYTELAKKLTEGLDSGALNAPSNAAALLTLANDVTSKTSQAKTDLENAIASLKAALEKKKAEIEAQKDVVENLGGAVPVKTTPTSGSSGTTVDVIPAITSTPTSESTTFLSCSDDWFIEIPENGEECPTTTTSTTTTMQPTTTTMQLPTATTIQLPNITKSTTASSSTVTSTTTTTPTTTPPKCSMKRIFGENCWDGSLTRKRIMGGIPANPNEFPYHVGLEIDGEYMCGGSIISKSWVLTAAHCVRNLTTNVTVGACRVQILFNSVLISKASRVRATAIVVHNQAQKFENPTYLVYDIALVKVEEPFYFSLPGVKPICFLAEENYWNITGTVTGWGIVPVPPNLYFWPDDLQKVSMNIISNADCQQRRAAVGRPVPPPDTFICTFTANKNFMRGDSGGPLVAEVMPGCWVQLGIVSYGTQCAALPGVYTRVSFFAGWIQANAV